MEQPFEINFKWIKYWFDKFNHQYFQGSLPQPGFTISPTRRQMGGFSYAAEKRGSTTIYTEQRIQLTNFYKLTEREYQNILLHEMVHYYIHFHQIKDTSAHGKVFRSLIDQLNNEYGWEVTITEKAAMETYPTYEAYAVLLLENKERGEYYATVVSRNYLGRIQHQVEKEPSLIHHGWYVTEDPYFATFPKVRTLRGRTLPYDKWKALKERLAPDHVPLQS
ncbi:SprT-like domain-containing protein [uncultured Porphyromonas sp.]|uniref:SprT-like domain-containing protein n=1 Tax=uncultured Porphyromonas sp. TaxID=159274 RepID=UPI002590E34A|nr:SprT-like domain-containing protein [uncultured Porphyromonas sp.]